MAEKDTIGNIIKGLPLQCSSCRMDTAGNHEWDCPCRPNGSKIIHQTIVLDAFGFWDNPIDEVWNSL